MKINSNKAELLKSDLYLPNDIPPKSESKVVDLFRRMARDYFGFSDYTIGTRFPDCVARQGKKRISIEFEFESRNFQIHDHNPSRCDWIVCWRDTWGEAAPSGLKIVELRSLFRFPFKVWFQPLTNEFAYLIGEVDRDQWSVPKKASEGDLILAYRGQPQQFFSDLFIIDSPVGLVKANWKGNGIFIDCMADITRVGTLAIPVTWREMRADKRLKLANFLNGAMAGRPCASAYWHVLLDMIVARNPSLSWLKKDYDPDKINLPSKG